MPRNQTLEFLHDLQAARTWLVTAHADAHRLLASDEADEPGVRSAIRYADALAREAGRIMQQAVAAVEAAQQGAVCPTDG